MFAVLPQIRLKSEDLADERSEAHLVLGSWTFTYRVML